MLCRTHCRFAVFIERSGKTFNQHLADPAHLLGRGRDSKEVADAVPDGADPSADLIPEPRSEGLNALPQPAHKVRADLHDFRNGLCKGGDNSRNDLRDRLDDLQNYGGEVFNEGDKQRHARFHQLWDGCQQCVHNGSNDLRQRFHNGLNDLR